MSFGHYPEVAVPAINKAKYAEFVDEGEEYNHVKSNYKTDK